MKQICLPILCWFVAGLSLGCAMQRQGAPHHAAEEAWQLMDAYGLGDGGTMLVRLRSPAGQVVSFDVRSPASDLQRRLHIHHEPFDFCRLPESRLVERGTPEEQRYGQYLSEALAPHLLPETTQERNHRFALSDAILKAFYRLDDAASAEMQAALKADLELALAASTADPVTDADWSVRIAQSVLHLIQARADDPSFGVYAEFPYNLGEFDD
ncbi:MAG: hypothetical protein AAF085_14755 [Planctomycetota bacterium]